MAGAVRGTQSLPLKSKQAGFQFCLRFVWILFEGSMILGRSKSRCVANSFICRDQQTHGVVVLFWHGGLVMPCHGEGTHFHFQRQLQHVMMVEALICTFSTHVQNSTIKRSGVSGKSRFQPFLGMKASHSSSRRSGMEFFWFSDFEDGFFSFPSLSKILGMVLFIPLPAPIPQFREYFYFIPFPFLNLLIHMRE